MSFEDWKRGLRTKFDSVRDKVTTQTAEAKAKLTQAADDLSKKSSETYQAARDKLLEAQLGTESAQEVKDIEAEVENAFNTLQEKVDAMRESTCSAKMKSAFSEGLAIRAEQDSDILFDEQRIARDYRLTAQAVLRLYELQPGEKRPFNEIISAAKAVEKAYAKLPEDYVELVKTQAQISEGAEGLVKGAGVVARQVGAAAESGLDWAQKQWQNRGGPR